MANIEHKFFKIYQLESKTLSWWKTRREKLDMEPPYQRKGRRWSVTDKQYLIDSILNGFDLPKFYFADFTWGKSNLNTQDKTYSVIDGKQRLEAIFDFFDNEIPLATDFKLLGDPDVMVGGKTFSELRAEFPNVAEYFENFNPVVMGVVTDEVGFVEELFVRLNRSKPLTGAEIRNAMSGAIPELLRAIANHQFFKSNLRVASLRGQHLNLAAKILLFEASGGPTHTKKNHLDNFSLEHAKSTPETLMHTLAQVVSTLDLMAEVFKYKDPLLGSEGPIPVYYWLVRNAESEKVREVRDFLEYFLQGLAYSKEDYDGEFIFDEVMFSSDMETYERMLRSVNDKRSNEIRYSILDSWFRLWPNEKAWEGTHHGEGTESSEVG